MWSQELLEKYSRSSNSPPCPAKSMSNSLLSSKEKTKVMVKQYGCLLGQFWTMPALRHSHTYACVCSVVSTSLQPHRASQNWAQLKRLSKHTQTVTCQAPPSMGLSRQESRAGHHFLLQGVFPAQGWHQSLLRLLHWQEDSSPVTQMRIILKGAVFLPRYFS